MTKKKRDNTEVRQQVLGRDGYFCFWCFRRIYSERDIPRHKRLGQRGSRLLWRGDGKVKEGLLATGDHVKPRWRGGATKPFNMVPSCVSCNHARGKLLGRTRPTKGEILVWTRWLRKQRKIASLVK